MIKKYNKHNCNFTGINWEYIAHGNGKDTILFLNGGLRYTESAYRYVEIFSHDYKVIVPAYPPLKDIDKMVQGIDNILQKEHVNNVILIGQSYGGMVAQVFAIMYPYKVKRLVLNSTASIFADNLKKALSVTILKLIINMPSGWIQKMYKKNLLKALEIKTDDNNEWMANAKNILDTKFTKADIMSHFYTAMDTLKKYASGKPDEEIIKRTLIVNGENDKLFSDKDRKQLIKDYPVANLVILKDTGHIVVIENPEEYKKLLISCNTSSLVTGVHKRKEL